MSRMTADISLAVKDLNLCVRAEAAAKEMHVKYVNKDGEIDTKWSPLGECVCVTCGVVRPYKLSKWEGAGMDGGHFLARCQASPAYLMETNVHPQCVGCNKWGSGAGEAYLIYMQHMYGQEMIDQLRLLKNTKLTKEFWTDEQIVAMRVDWKTRTRKAEKVIRG